MKKFVLAKDGLGNRYGLVSVTDDQVFITPMTKNLAWQNEGIFTCDYLDQQKFQVVGTLSDITDVKCKDKLKSYIERIKSKAQ